MPDYIPPINPGQFSNIAEILARTGSEAAKLRYQGSADLGQGIGQGLNQGIQNYLWYSAARPPSTSEMVSAGVVPKELPGGQTPEQAFGTRPSPQTARMLMERAKEEQMLNRLLSNTALKGQFAESMNMVPVTEGMRTRAQELGIPLDPSETHINKSLAEHLVKKENVSQLTPEEIERVAQDMARTGNAPSVYGGAFGGIKAKLVSRAKQINPNYNPQEAETRFTSQRAGGRLTGGGSVQVASRMAKATSASLEQLQQASDAFSRTGARFLNTPIINIASQSSPEAQNLRLAFNEVRSQYAQVLKGGGMPGEEELREAQAALPDNMTPAQLKGMIPLLRNLMGIRSRALLGEEEKPAAKPKKQQSAPASTPAADPIRLF